MNDCQEATIKHEPPLIDQWLIRATSHLVAPMGPAKAFHWCPSAPSPGHRLALGCIRRTRRASRSHNLLQQKDRHLYYQRFSHYLVLEMRDSSSSSLLSVMMRPLVMQYAKQQQRLNRDGERFEANTYITIISRAAYQFHNDRNEVSKLYHR